MKTRKQQPAKSPRSPILSAQAEGPVHGGSRTRKQAQTRSENLAQLLEAEILGGEIPPGARLDEQGLATRFGVSRTPVREALRHLASSGLVQIRAHHGAVVRQLTLTDLLEVFEVMAELEGLSARLAARRMADVERAHLRRSHEASIRHAQAGDQNAFFEENNRLHEIILNASRNQFLIQKVHELRRRVDPYRRYVTKQAGVMEKSIEEHAAVINAIEERDGAGAHDLMRSHLHTLGVEAGDFVAILAVVDLAADAESAKQRSHAAKHPKEPHGPKRFGQGKGRAVAGNSVP